jgi:hypothetical protein
MGLRDRITQPYVDAQERYEAILDLEVRATEFEERIEAAMLRVEAAENKATFAVQMLEQAEVAAAARTDAIVARHEALIARLEALVESKTPVRKAMVQAMVDEAVAARAAQLQESYRERSMSMAYMGVSASNWGGNYSPGYPYR